MINDLWHLWSDDLSASASGDLLPVNGSDRGTQRVLRRLLTNPGDYVFHPDYGAGLPTFIGQPLDAGKVAAIIRAHMLLEDCVAQLPPPQITVETGSSDASTISVTIAYNDAANGKPIVLAFNVSN